MARATVKVLQLAATMHGVLTRAQALRHLTPAELRHRLESRAWVCVFPSVYRVEGAPETWRQRLEAFALWAGRRAVLSHRTAAALQGLAGFKEGPLDATTTCRARPLEGVTLYEVEAFAPKDVVDLQDLRVTSLTRTLFDLAAGTDSLRLRAAVDQALREKRTSLAKLHAQVDRSTNRQGRPAMGRLLRELEGLDGPTESALEDEALALIEAAGLPRPKVQQTVVAGRKQCRLDLVFVEQRVVIEADGYAWHSGIESFERDRERNNALTARRFRVLHWTWQAIQSRPEELIEQLRVTLNTPWR